MATITNETLLAALNQVVQAITELTTGGGGGTTEVNVTPQITVNCHCSCGGGGGTTPPQTPGEEGGAPPPGTGTPDPIDDRKCKVAHILIHELIAYTDNMAALGLFDFTLDYSSLGGILNSLANGFSSGLLSLVFQVGGWLQNLQNLIFSGGFGASIPETLSANQDDMICALYNATNVSDAKTDVVAASGLTGQDAEYLRVILTTEALNMLFFSIPGSEGVIFNYQGAADCGGCNMGSVYIQPEYSFSDIINFEDNAGSFSWTADGSTAGISSVSIHTDYAYGISVDNMNLSPLTGWNGWRVELLDGTFTDGSDIADFYTAITQPNIIGIWVRREAKAFSGSFTYVPSQEPA